MKFSPARVSFIILAVLGSMGLMISFCPPPSLAQGTGLVKGNVFASGDGNPLKGAELELVGASYHDFRHTDDEGYYVFEAVPPGHYALHARADGYVEDRRDFDLSPDENRREDFFLDGEEEPFPLLYGNIVVRNAGDLIVDMLLDITKLGELGASEGGPPEFSAEIFHFITPFTSLETFLSFDRIEGGVTGTLSYNGEDYLLTVFPESIGELFGGSGGGGGTTPVGTPSAVLSDGSGALTREYFKLATLDIGEEYNIYAGMDQAEPALDLLVLDGNYNRVGEGSLYPGAIGAFFAGIAARFFGEGENPPPQPFRGAGGGGEEVPLPGGRGGIGLYHLGYMEMDGSTYQAFGELGSNSLSFIINKEYEWSGILTLHTVSAALQGGRRELASFRVNYEDGREPYSVTLWVDAELIGAQGAAGAEEENSVAFNIKTVELEWGALEVIVDVGGVNDLFGKKAYNRKELFSVKILYESIPVFGSAVRVDLNELADIGERLDSLPLRSLETFPALGFSMEQTLPIFPAGSYGINIGAYKLDAGEDAGSVGLIEVEQADEDEGEPWARCALGVGATVDQLPPDYLPDPAESLTADLFVMGDAGEAERVFNFSTAAIPPNYVELLVRPNSAGRREFNPGELVTIEWETHEELYGFRNVPCAVFLGAALDPPEENSVIAPREIAESRALFLFDRRLRPVPYVPGNVRPTWRAVRFPVPGLGSSGSFSFFAPPLPEGAKGPWVFGTAFVRWDDGRFPSIPSVEVSNSLTLR